MSILSGLARFFGGGAATPNGTAVNYARDVGRRLHPVDLAPRDLYAVLRAMYLTNGAYDDVRRHLWYSGGVAAAKLKPIRNPIPAVVDFFGAKAWPSPLTLTTPKTQAQEGQDAQVQDTGDPLIEAIQQVWAWSNWQRRQPEVARFAALFGEVYLKVVADQDKARVWFEVIEPCYVWDYEADERDFLTWIRLDVPQCTTTYDTGERRHYTRTEVWSRDDGTYRVWETEGDAYGRPINELGPLLDDQSGTLAELGIDFLPFVRIPFRELGEKRGIGAVLVALEAVAEADLMATNFHSVLFQDLEGATVITRDGVDANQRPLPPVQVAAAAPTFDDLGRPVNGTGRQVDGMVTVGNRAFWSLPGGAHFEYAVPQIDYGSALAAQQDHDTHLERLMPALAYSKISELAGADLSGRAIRFKLTAAIDQAEEARANLLAGLKQADMMALTLGQIIGVFERSLGSFDRGDFEHGFADQEVLPVSDYEQAQTRHEQASAMQAEQAAGVPLSEILVRSGYSEDKAAEVVMMAADGVNAQAGEQVPPMGQQMPPELSGAQRNGR